MTFTVKVRGAGGLIMAEYTCVEHGVFEALVQRDANGDAPDVQPCPVWPLGHRRGVPCGATSSWCISAPAIESEALKVRAVSLGGDMTERPKGMLDTRKIAEGQTMTEWKKERRQEQRERRHQQLVSKGIKPKRIQVG